MTTLEIYNLVISKCEVLNTPRPVENAEFMTNINENFMTGEPLYRTAEGMLILLNHLLEDVEWNYECETENGEANDLWFYGPRIAALKAVIAEVEPKMGAYQPVRIQVSDLLHNKAGDQLCAWEING